MGSGTTNSVQAISASARQIWTSRESKGACDDIPKTLETLARQPNIGLPQVAAAEFTYLLFEDRNS